MNKIVKVFPHGKTKAFTMSFDDGKDTDIKFLEIINRYKLKSTFCINSGQFGFDGGYGRRLESSEIKDIYKGHEIACHSLSHPTLPRCPKESIISELFEDRKNLEKVTGRTIRGLAYPNHDGHNKFIRDLVPNLGFAYGRSTVLTGNFYMPHDPYNWEVTALCTDDIISLGSDFITMNKPQYLQLFSIYGHAMDFDKTDSWDKLEEFCRIISGKDDIWYVTNIDFFDYQRAWDNLRFSATGKFVENPNAITCWVSVNSKTYEIKCGERVFF